MSDIASASSCAKSLEGFLSASVKAKNSNKVRVIGKAIVKGLKAREKCPTPDSLIEGEINELRSTYLEVATPIVVADFNRKCQNLTNTFLKKSERAQSTRKKQDYGKAYAQGLQLKKECRFNTSAQIEEEIELQKIMYLRN